MIQIRNLKISFNDNLVIDGISFNVKEGEILSILGPSGCGKTTLLNCISGLLDKNEAKVTGDMDMKYSKIAMVHQTPCLLPWKNVVDNISFASNKMINKDDIMEMTRIVGLSGFENHHPSELSLGMQQRVNLLRALSVEPDLILLDEPFSALDETTKNEVISSFKEILRIRKMTCILVTHNIEEAKSIANKLIYLSGLPTVIKEIKLI